jgi:hypothetical protein
MPSSIPNPDETEDDRDERDARAAAIRDQVEALRRGIKIPPKNPREFVDQATSEPDNGDTEPGTSTSP